MTSLYTFAINYGVVALLGCPLGGASSKLSRPNLKGAGPLVNS